MEGHRTLMIKLFFILFSFISLDAAFDFEQDTSSFILESKQIQIPGYPDAFNPSIVTWNGATLLCFRNINDPKDSYNTSEIGLVYLNKDFEAISTPQILKFNSSENHPCRAEDGRLIIISKRLHLVYSDDENLLISKGGFRVHVAELEENDGQFFLSSKNRITEYEGVHPNVREKNWTPFDYNNNLFLSYSLNPHLVFQPIPGTNACETIAHTRKSLSWQWGELRGGTQSLLVDGQYLTFFHSCYRMASEHSEGREMLHYFMGACSFQAEPPFEMSSVSSCPIVGKGFFSGALYKPYWGSWRGIFPAGFIFDEENIWVVYGRQNHESWVVKLDKRKLLESLIPVSN